MIKGTVEESNILLRRPAYPFDGNKGGLPKYIIKDPSKINVGVACGANPPF